MEQPDKTRRDVVTTAALSLVGFGSAVAAWPLVASLWPARDAPLPPTATVDLSGIAVGETRRIAWHTRPVLVRHRPFREREVAATPGPRRDHLARSGLAAATADASDDNRTLPGHRQWLVVIAACTREFCFVRDDPATDRTIEDVAFFCPCCATRYDVSGRVKSGPGPENLPVPRFVIRGTTLTIG